MCKDLGFIDERLEGKIVDLIARMIRRQLGWDRVPTQEEIDGILSAIREKIPEVRPCANMDTELIEAARRAAEEVRQASGHRVRIDPRFVRLDPIRAIDTDTHDLDKYRDLGKGFGKGNGR